MTIWEVASAIGMPVMGGALIAAVAHWQAIKCAMDIYVNGEGGLAELIREILPLWRYLFPAAGRFGEAAVEFIVATIRVVLVIVLPLLFWLVPVIALFTAHRVMPDEEHIASVLSAREDML